FRGGATRDAPAGRIGGLALGECFVIGAVSQEQAGQAEVSLVTAWLQIDPICLVTLPLELLDHGPGSRPHGRILDRVNDLKCVRVGAVPALALAHIVHNVEGSWGLNDPDIDAGEAATKLG